MKKLYFVLCMAFCMVALSACGKSNTSSTDKFDESTLKTTYEQTVSGLAGQDLSSITDEDTYENYASQNSDELAQSILGLYNTTKDLGSYESMSDVSVSYADGKATVEGKAKFEKDTVIVRMIFKSNESIESFSTDLYRTLGQKMVNALLNTIMGMGTVFIVLIFISLIISLLKYVPKLVERQSVKKDSQLESTVSSTPVQAPEVMEEEQELVDDGELVAVITAAIMASLGDEAPEDGLVVRSIRKVNHKWKNA